MIVFLGRVTDAAVLDVRLTEKTMKSMRQEIGKHRAEAEKREGGAEDRVARAQRILSYTRTCVSAIGLSVRGASGQVALYQ